MIEDHGVAPGLRDGAAKKVFGYDVHGFTIENTDERYEELRAWFAEEWKRGAATWTPDVQAVFDEGATFPRRTGLADSGN